MELTEDFYKVLRYAQLRVSETGLRRIDIHISLHLCQWNLTKFQSEVQGYVSRQLKAQFPETFRQKLTAGWSEYCAYTIRAYQVSFGFRTRD